MTIEALSQYYWINEEIKDIKNELSEITNISVSSPEVAVSGYGKKSPVESYVLKKSKLEELLETKLKELDLRRIEIEQYIFSIEDTCLRNIFRKRFLYCKSWTDIGDEVFMDRTTCYRAVRAYINKH